MQSKIKLALADDELLFRRGLISILSKEDHIDILFDAEDGNDLMNQLRAAKDVPEVIITDLKIIYHRGIYLSLVVTRGNFLFY